MSEVKQATLRVLEDASQFLRQFDLGPASIEILNNATEAKDFAPFAEVLRCHAILDTDAVGTKLFHALNERGAFDAATDASTWEAAKECEAYLVGEYAALVAGQQRVAPLAYGNRLSDCLSDISAADPVAGREVCAQVESLVAKAYAGDTQGIKDAFRNSSNQYTRDLVKGALYHVTALEQDAVTQGVPPQQEGRKPVAYGGLMYN